MSLCMSESACTTCIACLLVNAKKKRCHTGMLQLCHRGTDSFYLSTWVKANPPPLTLATVSRTVDAASPSSYCAEEAMTVLVAMATVNAMARL